jgi:hypothetical protein
MMDERKQSREMLKTISESTIGGPSGDTRRASHEERMRELREEGREMREAGTLRHQAQMQAMHNLLAILDRLNESIGLQNKLMARLLERDQSSK